MTSHTDHAQGAGVVDTVTFDKKRYEKAQAFFTAQQRLIIDTEVLTDNVHAVTHDPEERKRLDALISELARIQGDICLLLDTFLPPRPSQAQEADLSYVRAGHKAENRLCDHRDYSYKKNGRYCTCGTLMRDPGD